MSVIDFKEHVNAMTRIESMEHLKDLKTATYPNLKEDAQTKYHKEIHKKAFPVQKVYTFDDIENIFKV